MHLGYLFSLLIIPSFCLATSSMPTPTQLEVDGTREITLSPTASDDEVLILAKSLEEYNLQFVSEDYYAVSCAEITSQKKLAELTPETISFKVDEMLAKKGAKATVAFLQEVERTSYGGGTRRSQVMTKSARKPITGPLTEASQLHQEFLDLLKLNGYRLSSKAIDLKSGLMKQYWHKKLTAPKKDGRPLTPLLHTCDEDATEEPIKAPANSFTITLREQGKILGGLLGIRHIDNAFIPHVYIETFWLDESVRGHGAGTKILTHALNYAASIGAKVVKLNTVDYQAPKFYEKMGFTKVRVDPKRVLLKDGTYSNYYEYRLKLTDLKNKKALQRAPSFIEKLHNAAAFVHIFPVLNFVKSIPGPRNLFSFDPKKFGERILRQCRTLWQQSIDLISKVG